MLSTYNSDGLTVSVSEKPFGSLSTDICKKTKLITCTECDSFATHRVEREEIGVIVRTHYCKPCFDLQEL